MLFHRYFNDVYMVIVVSLSHDEVKADNNYTAIKTAPDLTSSDLAWPDLT